MLYINYVDSDIGAVSDANAKKRAQYIVSNHLPGDNSYYNIPNMMVINWIRVLIKEGCISNKEVMFSHHNKNNCHTNKKGKFEYWPFKDHYNRDSLIHLIRD